MKIELAGQVAVVTGGGKGVGRQIAVSLAQAGADVVILGRDMAALEDAASEIRRLGVMAHPLSLDVTDVDQMPRLVELIDTQCKGRLDIVVTAAGTRDHMALPIAQLSLSDFDAVLKGNLHGSLLPIRALLPAMVRSRRGKIILISGVFGLRPKANHAAGCVSKWALEGLAKVMALELGQHNINVNAICPGYIEGPRSAAGMESAAKKQGKSAAEVRDALVAATALKRLSTPEDVAHATLFLASEYSRNITGQDIVIDAGWMLN